MKDTKKMVIELVFGCLVFSILIGVLFSRKITEPLNTLENHIRFIAEGDLTQKIESKSKDEIGRDDTAITIKHMSVNVQQAAENSNIVTSSMNKTAQTASEGLAAIANANEQMVSIEKTVNNSAMVVANLGERSKEIGQIVDTISVLPDRQIFLH